MPSRPTILEGDVRVTGTLSGSVTKLSAGCVTDAKIADDAAIDATKVLHQFPIDKELFESATTVAAKTQLLHIVRGATGTIVGFEAAVVTKATGADRTASVDLKKSTGGGAFATILTGTIDFDDGSTNLTAVPATIATPSVVAGDILEAVVTVAGAAGNQALGLIATLTLIEAPE